MRDDLLGLADVELGLFLNLGNLNELPRECSGYRNVCQCPGCLKRAAGPVEPVRLPWENAA
jgi:hypothetical protein